jgi:hypothetical protein
MNKEKLEELYNERRLIKQLLSLDYPRYSYLESRSVEIKTIINSEYLTISNSDYRFALYDAKLADKIAKAGRESLRGLVESISDSELIRDIALYSIENTNVKQLDAKLLSSVNPMFAFAGLYPNEQKTYNIKPE